MPGEDHGLGVIQQSGQDSGEGMQASKVPMVPSLPGHRCLGRLLTSAQSAAQFCWARGHPESAATAGRAGSPAAGT